MSLADEPLVPDRLLNSDRVDPRALCVEDNIIVALDCQVMLEQLGFCDVYIARTYRDADYIIGRKPFDFALLDVNLGGGWNTLDLAKKLVASGTPAVFTSRFAFSKGLVSDLELPILEKPFDTLALSRMLQSLGIAALRGPSTLRPEAAN